MFLVLRRSVGSLAPRMSGLRFIRLNSQHRRQPAPHPGRSGRASYTQFAQEINQPLLARHCRPAPRPLHRRLHHRSPPAHSSNLIAHSSLRKADSRKLIADTSTIRATEPGAPFMRGILAHGWGPPYFNTYAAGCPLHARLYRACVGAPTSAHTESPALEPGPAPSAACSYPTSSPQSVPCRLHPR